MVTEALAKVSCFLHDYGWEHKVNLDCIESGFSTACKKYRVVFSINPTFVDIVVELLNVKDIYTPDKKLILKLTQEMNNELRFCRLVNYAHKLVLKSEILLQDLSENSFSTYLSILGYYSDEVVKELYLVMDNASTLSQQNHLIS